MRGESPSFLKIMKTKHCKTYHLPWSPGICNEDKVLKTTDQFEGKQVVITEKRDGECTSLYNNGTVHARSIDGVKHPWQSPIKSMWSERADDLPPRWRVVGENLFPQHTIPYNTLTSWLEVFAVFDERNVALCWDETVEWCELLKLITVPVLWEGEWDPDVIRWLHTRLDLDTQEGYVVRVRDSIPYEKWNCMVAKWVRPNHVQTDEHWRLNWKPNKLIFQL